MVTALRLLRRTRIETNAYRTRKCRYSPPYRATTSGLSSWSRTRYNRKAHVPGIPITHTKSPRSATGRTDSHSSVKHSSPRSTSKYHFESGSRVQSKNTSVARHSGTYSSGPKVKIILPPTDTGETEPSEAIHGMHRAIPDENRINIPTRMKNTMGTATDRMYRIENDVMVQSVAKTLRSTLATFAVSNTACTGGSGQSNAAAKMPSTCRYKMQMDSEWGIIFVLPASDSPDRVVTVRDEFSYCLAVITTTTNDPSATTNTRPRNRTKRETDASGHLPHFPFCNR